MNYKNGMKRKEHTMDGDYGLEVMPTKPIKNLNDLPVESLLTSSEVRIRKRD